MNVHFLSETVEWATPQDLYDKLDREFGFEVDVCATKENSKCGESFWSKKDDGLKQDWEARHCFMNPPYGREIGKWIQKAYESKANVVVAVLPARTDTKWFHDFIYKKPTVEIRFLKGILKFGGSKNSAPFPSMIVIFRPK